MRDLDNLENIKGFDESNMYEILLDFPQQYQRTYRLAKGFSLPDRYAQVRNIVVSGMGGSAIGGDLLKSLFNETCSVPILVNKEKV